MTSSASRWMTRLLLVGSLRQDGDLVRMIAQWGAVPFVKQTLEVYRTLAELPQ